MDRIKKRVHQYPAVKPFEWKGSYVETTRDSPGNQYDSHVHPECEIYVNLTGDVSFMVEKRIYPVLPGDIILTRPYEYHHCLYHSNDLHKHFWILFSAEGNEAFLDRFFCRRAGESNRLTLPADQQKELIALCHAMTDESGSPTEDYFRFFKLMHLLEQAKPSEVNDTAGAEDVTMVLDSINQHFTEPIVIRELAAAAHVSINTLERHFHEVLHMSPSAYLKKKRLAAAAEILYCGGSVMDACQNSGFADYCNFIALFKKTYGMTPLKYRNYVTRVE